MTHIADVLTGAIALDVDRLDAQLLLGHVLQRSRSWLIAHDEVPLTEAQREAVDALLQRRAQGEPLAYLVGEKEFHGLMLQVSPAVLIPRPDTETLVDWALELLSARPGRPRVIDLGTGSGAIALAIKHRHPHAEVTALDTSAQALAVATRNAQRLGLGVRFLQSDWWSAVTGERFDLVVSNPPYIADHDPHLPDLQHEPLLALTSGPDGMQALQAIAAGAHGHLLPGGWLLCEHGYDQADAVRALLQDHGFGAVQTRSDLAGTGRCTGGQWP